MATLDRNSKADTRFLSDRAGGGVANLVTDISQWRLSLTNLTTYATSTSSRLAVRSPREISVVVRLATGDSGIVVNWGNTAGTTYIYRITIAAGVLQFGHNDGLLASVTPPSVGGSARTYVVHWSTDYDALAAGYFSELAVYDVTSATWAVSRVTHTQPQAPAGGDQFNLIGRGAGFSLFTGGMAAIDFVRIGCRFHSTTEAKEDWVAESSAPSVTGVQPVVELCPSSPVFFTADPADDLSDALLDEGTLAGPAELAAVLNAAAARKRLYSPAVNMVLNDPPTLQDSLTTNFFRDLYTGLSQAWLGLVFARYQPYKANRLRVRVHVQAWIAAGAPMGTAVSIDLSVSAMSGVPTDLKPSINIVTITDDHTSTGVGQWYDLGALKVPGFGYLAIGWVFGAGTGHAHLRMKIKAVTMEPYESE
jgi:hypothetical protein